MPVFKPGQSFETREPFIEVTVDEANPLPFGSHTFQLVVEDDAKNVSEPKTITIIIADTERPTAVIFSDPQSPIPFGKSFRLVSKSVDAGGGQIVKHTWTLLEQLPGGGPIRPGPVIPPIITRPPIPPIR